MGSKHEAKRTSGLRARLVRIDWMMLFPVFAAVAFLFGELAMAMVLVVILPLFLALDGRLKADRPGVGSEIATGQAIGRVSLHRIVDDVLEDCARRDRTTAVLHIQVDDLNVANGDWGKGDEEQVMDRAVMRVAAAMRGQDAILRSGNDAIIVVLAPTRRVDMDVLLAIVDRVQSAISEPISMDGRTVRIRSCVGVCAASMAPSEGAAALLAAADCALRIARRHGDDAVRFFNADMREQVETDHRLASQIDDALEAGDIRPWFQPQINARTGRLTGFEALARWHHPELGLLTPDRFLSAIHSTGRGSDLGDSILRDSLAALVEWEKAGIDVPSVGVNVSLDQLMDPRMAERVIWQVDRFDIKPSRVAIEILETVTLREGDETIVRNLTALREAGFRLDLDDFGTGAASIAHIARFGVHRIKIDRSFISGIDRDKSQREIVAAIFGLAERLGIETLAEGVETPEEKATLNAMGCVHLQGFGISRPMPFRDTVPWALSTPSAANEELRRMEPRGTA